MLFKKTPNIKQLKERTQALAKKNRFQKEQLTQLNTAILKKNARINNLEEKVRILEASLEVWENRKEQTSPVKSAVSTRFDLSDISTR